MLKLIAVINGTQNSTINVTGLSPLCYRKVNCCSVAEKYGFSWPSQMEQAHQTHGHPQRYCENESLELRLLISPFREAQPALRHPPPFIVKAIYDRLFQAHDCSDELRLSLTRIQRSDPCRQCNRQAMLWLMQHLVTNCLDASITPKTSAAETPHCEASTDRLHCRASPNAPRRQSPNGHCLTKSTITPLS